MLPRVLRGHSSISAFQMARHAFRPDTTASSEFSSKIAGSFSRDPESTGKQILRFLGPEERSELIKILCSHNGTSVSNPASQAASRVKAPSLRALGYLAVAAGVPFIAFGFMDNAIMIVAGEEIENAFGARFGLSTLAAAGFGNLISDVIGIGTAEPVQAKFSQWFPMKPLTGQQQVLWQSREPAGFAAAKFGGSAAGVSAGCLLGMAPLLFIDGHKDNAHHAPGGDGE